MGGRRFREMHLCLVPEDERETSRALEAAFPGLRYLTHEYWKEPDGPPYRDQRPPNFKIHYREGLDDAREMCLYIWIEPESWKPEWTGPNDNGIWYVNNQPGLWFQYQRGMVTPYMPNYVNFKPGLTTDEIFMTVKVDPADLPVRGIQSYFYGGSNDKMYGHAIRPEARYEGPIVMAEGYENLGHGRIWASWMPEDIEQKQFIDKVCRIFRKHTTNFLVEVDLRTGSPFGPPIKGGMLWAGKHALEWARAKPHRFIRGSFKPADWYDDWLAKQDEEASGD